MATMLVGRWLKRGKKRLYSEHFGTKLGAVRAGNKAARKAGKNYKVLPPYYNRPGVWTVRIYK